MMPHTHARRSFGTRGSGLFPTYLVRESDHIPDIEMMMERHRIVRLGAQVGWIEHITVQRVADGFLLYTKLSDARQMAHHPAYGDWIAAALPLDEALGSGWLTITEDRARDMLGDSMT